MKSRTAVIASVVTTALVCATCATSVHAQLPALTIKDSSAFNHQYNGDVLLAGDNLPNYFPDEPFDLQPPTTDGDILTYQSSGPSAGADWNSSQWNTDVSYTSGWTIDVRMKVGTESPGATRSFNIFAGDGGSYGFFSINQNTFGDFVSQTAYAVEDNSTAFHNFRFAKEAASETIDVWRDNVFYGTMNGVSSGAVAMWFGDGTGAGGGPTIQIDHFRWDSSGAYAPTGQVLNIAGDLNHDGAVNLTDYGVLTGHWLQAVVGASSGDLNGDGTVDISDFAMFKSDYIAANGGNGNELAAVPEPSTILLTLGVLPACYFVGRRRCRKN
ncbi:MAG: dockerin type I domain-containing protein [Singulisphaera sp.]